MNDLSMIYYTVRVLLVYYIYVDTLMLDNRENNIPLIPPYKDIDKVWQLLADRYPWVLCLNLVRYIYFWGYDRNFELIAFGYNSELLHTVGIYVSTYSCVRIFIKRIIYPRYIKASEIDQDSRHQLKLSEGISNSAYLKLQIHNMQVIEKALKDKKSFLSYVDQH